MSPTTSPDPPPADQSPAAGCVVEARDVGRRQRQRCPVPPHDRHALGPRRRRVARHRRLEAAGQEHLPAAGLRRLHGVRLALAGGRLPTLQRQPAGQPRDHQLLVQRLDHEVDDRRGDHDRCRHPQQRHAGGEQGGQLVEPAHPHQRERRGHDRDDAGELAVDEESLGEVVAADAAEALGERRPLAAAAEFVEVEEGVHHHVEPDQHDEGDDVVLQERGEDGAVDGRQAAGRA